MHQPSQVPLQPQHAFQNRYTGHLHPAQHQVLPTQSHASQLQSPAVAPNVATISSSPPVLWQVPQVQTPTIPIAASTAQWEGRSRSPSPGLHGPRSQSAENVSLRRPSTPPAPFAVSTLSQCPGASMPSTPRFMAQEAQAMAKAAAVAVAKAETKSCQ
ncbi:desi1 [Symbiodinium sp. CCMP2592]|nr:desi1 [Symbiodinium sp. CCMP2592]